MNDVRKSIGWADYTWNSITGCSPISEGCRNCYAAAISKRFGLPWGKPVFHPERLDEPLRRKKPAIIFICSMSDLFHEQVPDQWIDQVFAAMALCPQHTFLVLTKRPERAAKWISYNEYCRTRPDRISEAAGDNFGLSESFPGELDYWPKWPLPNVWLGVTAENQEQADKRIPTLLSIPAAHHFVSVEPMLGPVDLTWDVGTGEGHRDSFLNHGLDLVICGPETGPKARPCDPAWIEDLARQSPRFYDKRKENPIARWRPGDQVSGHRLAVER